MPESWSLSLLHSTAVVDFSSAADTSTDSLRSILPPNHDFCFPIPASRDIPLAVESRQPILTPLGIFNHPFTWMPSNLPLTPPRGKDTMAYVPGSWQVGQRHLPLSPPFMNPAHLSKQGPPGVVNVPFPHARQRSNSSRTSMSSRRDSTHTPRKWSVTVDEVPGGGIKATGLIADDGTFISHGSSSSTFRFVYTIIFVRPGPAHPTRSFHRSGIQ